MVIRAVLFDLDDTLWRRATPPDWDEISTLQANELSPHFTKPGLGHLDALEFVRGFWANFDSALLAGLALEEPYWMAGIIEIRRALARYGLESSESDSECLWEALHNVPLLGIDLFHDAHSTVDTLSAAGYRLAILTNRPLPGKLIARHLQERGLHQVEAIITSVDVGYRKPHPLLFESALKRLEVSPDETVVVGDSYETDIVPAAQLGMVPILKLNDREPNSGWVLARHQVSTLAALLDLEILTR